MPVTLLCLQGMADPVPVKTSSHPPSSLSVVVVVATSAVVVGGGSVGVPFDAECPLVDGDPAAVASGTSSAVTVGFPADAPTPFPSVLATSSVAAVGSYPRHPHHHRRTRSPRAWCTPHKAAEGPDKRTSPLRSHDLYPAPINTSTGGTTVFLFFPLPGDLPPPPLE